EEPIHLIINHVQYPVLQGFPLQYLQPERVYFLPLLVHYIIIFQQVLSDVKIVSFHSFLRILYGPGYHLVLNGNVLLHFQEIHQTAYPVGAENAHEVVLKGQIKPRGARVSLSSRPASKLIVCTPCLMAFSSDYMEPACAEDLLFFLFANTFCLLRGRGEIFFTVISFVLQEFPRKAIGIAAKDNIGTPARHVSRNSHRPKPTGLCNNLRFILMVFGVEYRMFNAFLLQ